MSKQISTKLHFFNTNDDIFLNKASAAYVRNKLARFKNIETKWKYANQGEVKKSLSHFYPIFLLYLF